MSIKELLYWIGGSILGSMIGYSLNSSTYISGRLSACKDVTSVLNKASPTKLDCIVDKKEVYIVASELPGAKFTLDGRIVKD